MNRGSWIGLLWWAMALDLLAAPSGPPALRAAASPPPLSYQTRYYFTIDLDPSYRVVGTGALTEEAARRSNCYAILYDAQGRPARLEYRRAGAPARDPFFQVERIDFEQLPGVERRWYRDGVGQLRTNVAAIYGEEITVDPSGAALDVANLDEEGARARDNNGVIHYARTLDEMGRVVRARRLGLLGSPIVDQAGDYETRSVYDGQGRRIEYANYNEAGALLNDREGIAVTRTIHTFYPDAVEAIESYFDAAGLPTEVKSSGIHSRQRVFDRRGLLQSEAYFDSRGASTLDVDGVHKRQFDFDALGNILSEEYFGTENKLVENRDPGYARVTYSYDDKNRVQEKAFFGDDGTPIVLLSLGAAIIRQEYNAKGELVRRQFFDGQHHPSNHVSYGAPAVRVEVLGDTTRISLRDARDRPMENSVNGFAAFSFQTASDDPLTPKNRYFNRHGTEIGWFRAYVINPHLHALRTDKAMQYSARLGAAAALLGSLLATALARKKVGYIRQRKVYVPTGGQRFWNWLATLAIVEGGWRFLLTIWWAYVGYQNGEMGPAVYLIEAVILIYFAVRLFRLRVTLRVLNVDAEQVHVALREFFVQAKVVGTWQPEKSAYISPALLVYFRVFRAKHHVYLALQPTNAAGRSLALRLRTFLRAQAATLPGAANSPALRFYYPAVTAAYGSLGVIWAYVFWTLLTR